MCQTESLFTWTVFTRKPGIPLHNKRWTCACASELCCECACVCVCVPPFILRSISAPAQQPVLFPNYISNSFRCDRPCLEPRLLLSLPPSPGQQGREREHEPAREQPWPPALDEETMATRLRVTAGDRNRHKHRNCPFCHWDSAAGAWESGGGTVSLSLLLQRSLSLFRYALIWQKSDRLTDCMLLLASGPTGSSSERHRVVGNEAGIF